MLLGKVRMPSEVEEEEVTLPETLPHCACVATVRGGAGEA